MPIQQDVALDFNKFDLTTASVDYAIHLVSSGDAEALSLFVANPESFIEHRKDTVTVVIDETALWLKLRGEEQVFHAMAEVLAARERRKLRSKMKAATTSDTRNELNELVNKYLEQHEHTADTRDMVHQFFHCGGDKHRLTLVNMSFVSSWFDPEKVPGGGKNVCVLLVFAEHHCRSEDISDEHTWNKDVTYETSVGTRPLVCSLMVYLNLGGTPHQPLLTPPFNNHCSGFRGGWPTKIENLEIS